MMKINDTDKSTWQTVRFGDVVREAKEMEQDPLAKGITRYVGLADLDPESIQLKRWGEIAEDSTTFTRLFRKGQVLFGRRRAYQRKAALAPFDGICSGDIIVMEARPEKLLPELLPFLVHTDGFFEYAMRTSAGSLSPRTKWSHLARYEFALPPLAEQRRIAEVLWEIERCINSNEEVLSHLRFLKRVVFGQHSKEGWDELPLKDLTASKPQYGINAPAKDYKSDMPRFVRITDIDDFGNLLPNEIVGVDVDDYRDYVLKENDFLFARTGNTVGKTYLYQPKDGHCVFAGYLIRFRLNTDQIIPKYLFEYTKTGRYENWITSTVRIGAQPNINATEYGNMNVPLPPIDRQRKVVAKLQYIDDQIVAYNKHTSKTRRMRKSLLGMLGSRSA